MKFIKQTTFLKRILLFQIFQCVGLFISLAYKGQLTKDNLRSPLMSNNYNQTTNTNIQSGRRHRRSTKYQHSLIIIQNYETKVNTQYIYIK